MKACHLQSDVNWSHYDSIGNLTRDLNEGIIAIYWTVTGKGREGFFEHRTRINERRFKKYLRMNELHSTQNVAPNGIWHSSIKNTSSFVNRCSLFDVHMVYEFSNHLAASPLRVKDLFGSYWKSRIVTSITYYQLIKQEAA